MKNFRFSAGSAERRLIFQVAKIENLIPENDPLKEGNKDEQNNPEKKNEENKGKEEKDVNLIEEVLGKKNEREQKAEDDTQKVRARMEETEAKLKMFMQMPDQKETEKAESHNKLADDIATVLTGNEKASRTETETRYSKQEIPVEMQQGGAQAVDAKQETTEVADATAKEEQRTDATKTENAESAQQGARLG